MKQELSADQLKYLENLKKKNWNEIKNDLQKGMANAVSNGILASSFIEFFEKAGTPKDILEELKKSMEHD